MKRIVLKPQLQIGEQVDLIKFGKSTGVITIDDITAYGITGHREGQPKHTVIFDWHEFDIIESPEEQEQVADAGKVIKPPLNSKMGELYAELSGVYSERAKILAAFAFYLASDKSRKFKVGTAAHPLDDKDWDNGWRTILVIELPEQIQLTWHFSDADKYLLDSLQPFPNYKWDGHTTDEKYKRLIDYFLPVTVSAQQKEKPPLKLRVGGVYKDGYEEVEKLVYFDSEKKLFLSAGGSFYNEQCQYQHLDFGFQEKSKYNLIEEVQPEQEKEEVEYCDLRDQLSKFVTRWRNQREIISSLIDERDKLQAIVKELRQANKDLVNAAIKKEGNPFKVGEKIKVKNFNGDYYFVTKIKEDIVYFQGAPDMNTWQSHYKQCERVE